jgi:hypothetical protein
MGTILYPWFLLWQTSENFPLFPWVLGCLLVVLVLAYQAQRS